MILDPRGTEEVHEARVVLHGEAVPEGAGDGRPEARLGRGDPDVADSGDGEAAAHREALDLRDDGLAHALEPPRPALAVPLVLDPVLRGLEALELRDVGARHEGLAAGAGQHQRARRPVLGHLLADLAWLPERIEEGTRQRTSAERARIISDGTSARFFHV